MVGKRRKHKTVVPYRKITGSGSADVPAHVQNLGLRTRRAHNRTYGPGPPGEDPRRRDHPDHEPKHSDDEVEESEGEYDEEIDEQLVEELENLSVKPPKTRNLPLEIIDIICFYCADRYPLLFVNHNWHEMAIKHLYAKPKLSPRNFFQFVQAISQERLLGSNVKDLDLVKIAQVGEKSMTSRLLRRCSPKLERFIAAQSHFGYLPMISLAACHRLKVLDLSLVSETVDLPQLFKTISNFHDLEVLHFPRSSIACPEDAEMPWAPNLTQLGLSGGFPAGFLEHTQFPPSLTQLQISNCPYLTTASLIDLLVRIGPQLTTLAVTYPVPQLAGTALDSVFFLCPNMKTFHVSIDYISRSALDPELMPLSHPLQNLYLLSSGMIGHSEKIKPSDVFMATDQLPDLKRVTASLLMGWKPDSEVLMALVETMNERDGGVWMV